MYIYIYTHTHYRRWELFDLRVYKLNKKGVLRSLDSNSEYRRVYDLSLRISKIFVL